VRSLAVALLALCTAACVGSPAGGAVTAPVLACDAQGGLCAVYTPGARNVRVLLVRPPSIVRMREVFVPAGDAVAGAHWTPDGLIVDTERDRYALDPRTGTLAALPPSPQARRVMARR
jgi:hypothetical protein